MKTSAIVGLRMAYQLLGSMVQSDIRLYENKRWQMAANGIAGLIKEIEDAEGRTKEELESELLKGIRAPMARAKAEERKNAQRRAA